MEDGSLELAALIVGFLIRLALPLLLTLILAWFLLRLDARWQAEAEAEAAQPAADDTVASEQVVAGPRCWEVRQCPPDRRQGCPAFHQPDTPCWELFRSNGRLAGKCVTCEVWRQAQAILGAAKWSPNLTGGRR